MTYTVHLGLRSEAWPGKIAEERTREAAQRAASAAVLHASHEHKAEVRIQSRLLDTYARRGEQSVRHVYEARQRAASA